MPCYVYIMASDYHGTLYVGRSLDLARRALAHREGALPGFTARYGVKRLVWYEAHDSLEAAALREKRLKRWHRDWKTRLIEQDNPTWRPLRRVRSLK